MKLLVTGGAGFIGSHYVRSVLTGAWGGTEPDSVVVLDKLTYAGNLENLAPVADDDRLRIVEGDILDRRSRRRADGRRRRGGALRGREPRGPVDPRGRRLRDDQRGRHPDAARLRASQHGIAKFVHVSTDEVYGSIAEGSWDEEQPLQPNSPYSASKASSDLFARAYHRTHGLPVCVTRCSNNYGPYQFPEKVIPLFVTNLMDGAQVPLYGEGANVRDWLHVDDHCRALHLVLERGRAGEVYNIGGGTELSNKELTGLLLRGDRHRLGPGQAGHRPPGPRPALLRRLHQEPHRARLRAAGRLRAGPRRHRRVVPDQPLLVGAAQGARAAVGVITRRW